jgi:hypothetical protein
LSSQSGPRFSGGLDLYQDEVRLAGEYGPALSFEPAHELAFRSTHSF